ncbi:protein argonaute 2-like [Meles meles]|uniref:protein argonaute 2-like n=1 Tax=Meles meles TaxID=9662 RepID=UPI001E69C8BE|nr:protein argonaute 2-like [Meles meles]
MAPRAAIRAARPVRRRCPRVGLGADRPAAAAGARRVVGLSRPARRGASGRGSAERRARRFLEPHPRRKAGGAPAGGGGRGGSGGRGGPASGASRGCCCWGGSGGGVPGGRTKGPAGTAQPADSARRLCGRVGRGESYQQLGAALRSTARAATLPARSPGRTMPD